MNNAMKKTMMALAICSAMCANALAAPKVNPPKGGKAPTAMVTTSKPRMQRSAQAAPKANHPTPARGMPRHEVAKHKPQQHKPAPAMHHEPRHDKHHHDHHHNSTLHTEDWCSMGASLVGGILGGLIGAAM